jgi:hypothetical protein
MNDITALRERVATFDAELVLGHVAWLTIPEAAATTVAALTGLCARHKLTPPSLPTAPRAADVFKRACTSVQANRLPTGDPNVYVNLLSRRVGHDADHVWRRLVQEVVDTSGHTLSYDEVYEFRFDRGTNNIVTTSLTWMPRPEAVQAASEVQAYFDARRDLVTSFTIREWVRAVLRGLSSVALRDGVYYLPAQHADQMHALEAVVNDLPAATFHTLPLIDDRKQRAMLKQAFEDESVGEADRLIGQIAEILHDPDQSVTTDRFANLKVEYDRLRGRVVDYSDMLSDSMGSSAARLEVLQASIGELLDRVKL